MYDLVLYYMPTCPFCQKVLTFLKKNDIEVELRDTLANQEFRKELLKLGGKTQVPCLIINQTDVLYESDDIIAWFKNNLKKIKQD